MRRVVLVLGAGASRPYGLPTSKDLRAILLGTEAGDEALISLGIDFGRILSALEPIRGETAYHELFRRNDEREIPKGLNVARAFVDAALWGWGNGISRNRDVERMRQRFFGSQRVSIDAFITNNPDLESIAKHAVAAVLTLCEREERLEGDWYQQLLERLMRGGTRDAEFGIITFNYDRSFERYFRRAYIHNYKEETKAIELYRRIKLIHAYGDLGSLEGNTMPPLLEYGDLKRFGPAVTQMDLATPAHASRQGAIREMLDGVDRVVFLGFGFWKENMDFIEVDKANPPEMYASAFGLPVTVMKDTKARYPNIIFGDRSEKLLDFVLSHPVFA